MSIDLIIVLIFFVVIFGIGIYERKKLTIEDYWVNNRNTNMFALIATSLSTFIGAGAILGNAGIAFESGGLMTLVVGGSYFVYFLIFSLFFAPKIKEFGDKYKAYTLPDFFEVRYSNAVRLAGAFVNLISWALFLALQMLAIGTFVAILSGINPIIATIIGGLIVIIYTTIGGLRADIRTDIFQFLIMLLLLVIFLPMIIMKSGGFSVIAGLPTEYLMGTAFAPLPVMILAFFFLGAATLTSADLWQRAYAGRTTKTVKWSMVISSILTLLFMIMAVLLGVFGRILLPDSSSNMVISDLLKTFLPTGLFGLILAGFFAAIMSSADTVLLVTNMTLVHDIYNKVFKKDISPEKVLSISRWTSFIVGLIGLIVALIVFSIIHLAIQSVSFYVALLPAIVFGFYWKKATAKAALWSIIFGTLTIIVFLFIEPVQAFIPGIVVSFTTFFLVNFWELRKQRKLGLSNLVNNIEIV